MAMVVFLRGVNVGGNRTFRPSVLARNLKRYDAVNVGAAGTLVIRKPPGLSELRAELVRRLPAGTEIAIRSGRDVLAMTAAAPFKTERSPADTVRFVSILARRPRLLPSIPLRLPADGDWFVKVLAMERGFVFGTYRRHMKTIRYLGMIDTVFGVRATTRNWNTFTRIVRVLEESKEIHATDQE